MLFLCLKCSYCACDSFAWNAHFRIRGHADYLMAWLP